MARFLLRRCLLVVPSLLWLLVITFLLIHAVPSDPAVAMAGEGATPEQIGALLPQHLEYMIGLEKKGVLFASGPLADAEGKTRGDGLTMISRARRP